MTRRRAACVPVLLALAVGCTADGGPESRASGGAVVLATREGAGAAAAARREAAEEEDEIAAVAAATEEALARGDYEAALKAGDALLARGMSGAARARLEPLRAEARRRLLQTTVLDGLIRTDADRFALGDPVTGEVLLINLSGSPIKIYDAPPGGSRAAPGGRTSLHFDVRYEERDATGTIVNDRITWTVGVGRDVLLPPGGRASFPLSLDTLAQNPAGTALRTYEISASLYPTEMTVGGESATGSIRFRPRTVRVFPRNYEHLVADPVGRLGEAIRKRSPVHLPLAAALVAPADRAAALDVVRAALNKDGPDAPDAATQTAVCVAAQILTGDDAPADPAAWRVRLAAGR